MDIGSKWRRTKSLARLLRDKLPPDRFSRQLLHGSICVALDKRNPVRGNLFAAGIRELLGFTLDSLAPEERVTKCSWYKKEPKTSGPTRRQRFSYICHKGLDPDYVSEELGLDIGTLHKPLGAAIKQLHKATHVRPGSVVKDEVEVEALVYLAITALLSLFLAAERCEKAVCDALADYIHDALMMKLMSDVYDALDELSTHTRVEGHYIQSVDITHMDHEAIFYSVEGSVDVDLQYGSDADVRNDMGATMGDSYPYLASLEARIKSPDVFNDADIEINIDNTSFFE